MATVLIVDDEASCRSYLRDSLDGLGLNVRDVASIRHAEMLMQSEAVDLLIIDIVLTNGEDGLQFVELSRKSRGGAGLIVMTGHPTEARAKQSRLLGAIAYLEKPFDLLNFKRCVQDFLDRRSLLREVHRLEQELAYAKDVASIEAGAGEHVVDDLWIDILTRLGNSDDCPPSNPYADPA